MLYNNDFEICWLVNDHISSLLREAEQERLVRLALAGTAQRNPYTHRFLAWLGSLLFRRLIDPANTRPELITALELVIRRADVEPFKLGVFQV